VVYIRKLSVIVLVPLSIPAPFIDRCCGCPILTICEILLPWLLLLLHRSHIQTELCRKHRVNVRLNGLLWRHELLLHR